jgi:hypothetical protein
MPTACNIKHTATVRVKNYSQTDKQIKDMQTNRQSDKQIKMDGHEGRQADKQTEG